LTLTVNDPVETLPDASRAWQPTVVVPIGKVLPDAGEQVIVVGPLRSAAVAAKVTVAPAVLVAFVMTFGGIVSVGGVVSTTLTTKEALAVFPAASVAVHSTVVAPIGKNEPEGVLHETLTACPSSSTAVGTGPLRRQDSSIRPSHPAPQRSSAASCRAA
jgi:hypothetical protein